MMKLVNNNFLKGSISACALIQCNISNENVGTPMGYYTGAKSGALCQCFKQFLSLRLIFGRVAVPIGHYSKTQFSVQAVDDVGYSLPPGWTILFARA